jgi:hypothetical protein
MSYLTGHPDTDLIILSQLDDLDLEYFCRTNQTIHHLCHHSDLWYIKLASTYQFPNLYLEPQEYKTLYYKIKQNQWVDIIDWIETNDMEQMRIWLNSPFIKNLREKQKHLLNQRLFYTNPTQHPITKRHIRRHGPAYNQLVQLYGSPYAPAPPPF